MADPRLIQHFSERGSSDMDFILCPMDRWSFVLVFARIHFIDLTHTATVVQADVSISVVTDPDAQNDRGHDTELEVIQGRGLGFDMNFRVKHDEESHWLIQAGQGLRFQWTNPDDGLIGYGIEAGVVRLGDLPFSSRPVSGNPNFRPR